AEVDDDDLQAPTIVETPLRNALHQRHVAAGKRHPRAGAVARPGALVAATRGLAVPRPNAAADPLARLVLLNAAIDVADIHGRVDSRSSGNRSLRKTCLD